MKHYSIFVYSFFLLWSTNVHADQALPVVLVHGLLADTHQMKPLEGYIEKYLPNTYVKNIQLGLGKFTSFWNMYAQTEWLAQELQNDPELAGGFNMICHSQGGLVGRYYLQRYNNPPVHTYISLGTPHMGVCGTPGTYDNRFFWLNLLETYAYQLLYTSFFQNFVSFAGYWRDVNNYDLYLAKCRFLPLLNNEKDHDLQLIFRQNITNLKNMVLIAAQQEDIIEPAESCHFGYYRPDSFGTVTQSLTESDYFKENALGIKDLYESDRLHLLFADCDHINLQHNEQNFVNNALPFLLADDMNYDEIVAAGQANGEEEPAIVEDEVVSPEITA